MSKTRILVADDHALVREGIIALLKCHDDIEVLAEAADGRETIDKAVKLRPDIVLMDIAMPGLGGLEATLEIKKANPDIKILVLSQYDDKEYISRLLKAKVSGYILKHAVGTDLISAIRAVARGEFYLYSSIASSLVDDYLSNKEVVVEDPYERLTDREKQVLKLVAEGNTHKEIAILLNISVKTAMAHFSNIQEKLGIRPRAGLIKFAIRRRIIQIDS
ncbi:MAG: response regulator transcription factor [Deltaproteobacteria bacterium]|jgi:two-component system response regulator NreC|nr:response regulator transcription factor [Deltaproteobacteria bacterium]